jgi:hypothetical protein
VSTAERRWRRTGESDFQKISATIFLNTCALSQNLSVHFIVEHSPQRHRRVVRSIQIENKHTLTRARSLFGCRLSDRSKVHFLLRLRILISNIAGMLPSLDIEYCRDVTIIGYVDCSQNITMNDVYEKRNYLMFFAK